MLLEAEAHPVEHRGHLGWRFSERASCRFSSATSARAACRRFFRTQRRIGRRPGSSSSGSACRAACGGLGTDSFEWKANRGRGAGAALTGVCRGDLS